MKWRLPGPQLPAQAVRLPVNSASAPGREGAVVPLVGRGRPIRVVARSPNRGRRRGMPQANRQPSVCGQGR